MPRLIHAPTGETLLENIEMADSFWKRFKGLQFRRSLPPRSGVLLDPCSSLHTCFMRFPIDVIHLDNENRVISVSRSIQPWRLHLCPKDTRSVIETMPNVVEATKVDSIWLV